MPQEQRNERRRGRLNPNMKALSVWGGWTGRRSRVPTGDFTVAFGHGHPLVAMYVITLTMPLALESKEAILIIRCQLLAWICHRNCECSNSVEMAFSSLPFYDFCDGEIILHSDTHTAIIRNERRGRKQQTKFTIHKVLVPTRPEKLALTIYSQKIVTMYTLYYKMY